MQDLKELREEINQIDQQLAELYEKRMNMAKEIAKYKYENKLPIMDLTREKEVVLKNVDLIKSKDLKQNYEQFLHFLMDQSKEIQDQYMVEELLDEDIPF